MEMKKTLTRRQLLAALSALALPAAPLFAQDAAWPTRPVRIIAPSSAGGGTDAFARILAQQLSEQTKQNFVVDNRPGASGNIGADFVAKSEPDGYTILVASNSSLAINPVLLKQMPFDVERDLAPISQGVITPMVIVAVPETGWKTMRDMVEAGKQQPGRFAYGSGGVGSALNLGVRMIEEATGARFTHVPYKGVAPAYQDLLAGRIHLMFTDPASVMQHITSGRVRPLAITHKLPSLLPDVPTLDEAGYGEVRPVGWFGVMAPAKVPPEIIRRIAAEVGRALRNPGVAQRLEQLALIPVHDTPQQFAAELRKEREYWGAFIRRNKITVD